MDINSRLLKLEQAMFTPDLHVLIKIDTINGHIAVTDNGIKEDITYIDFLETIQSLIDIYEDRINPPLCIINDRDFDGVLPLRAIPELYNGDTWTFTE